LPLQNVLDKTVELQESYIVMGYFKPRNKEELIIIKHEYKTFIHRWLKKPKKIEFNEPQNKDFESSSELITEKNPKKIIKFLIKYAAIERFFSENDISVLANVNIEEMSKRLFPKNKTESIIKIQENKPEQMIAIQENKPKLMIEVQENKVELIDKTPENKIQKIKWLGQNKTEFVQLIYALYHAKLITNETNEITKLVKDLAQVLDFDLLKTQKIYFVNFKLLIINIIE